MSDVRSGKLSHVGFSIVQQSGPTQTVRPCIVPRRHVKLAKCAAIERLLLLKLVDSRYALDRALPYLSLSHYLVILRTQVPGLKGFALNLAFVPSNLDVVDRFVYGVKANGACV